MDTASRKLFIAKVTEICKEFGVENASITGNTNEEYIGLLMLDPVDHSPCYMFEAAMNVGRLWQHARTSIRAILNDFDKS